MGWSLSLQLRRRAASRPGTHTGAEGPAGAPAWGPARTSSHPEQIPHLINGSITIPPTWSVGRIRWNKSLLVFSRGPGDNKLSQRPPLWIDGAVKRNRTLLASPAVCYSLIGAVVSVLPFTYFINCFSAGSNCPLYLYLFSRKEKGFDRGKLLSSRGPAQGRGDFLTPGLQPLKLSLTAGTCKDRVFCSSLHVPIRFTHFLQRDETFPFCMVRKSK